MCIRDRLGRTHEPDAEFKAILHKYDLNPKFPSAVEQQTKEIPDVVRSEDIGNRQDCRGLFTFTIDPDDAKDFDDAISFTPLSDGKTEIGIHIADVSHYVQPDSILDEEAYQRATSVYLVDRVVPMLPEILSNGACSLMPHEEKYTFSAVFTVNEKMEIQKEWFGKTVILSDHRFSYE